MTPSLSSLPIRPLLALLLAGSILGVIQGYMSFQAAIPRESAIVLPLRATGRFDVEITLTFDADADPFSIDQGESVLVTHLDQTVLRKEGLVAGGRPLLIEDVPAITVGRNEFIIKANPRPRSEDDAADATTPADPFNQFAPQTPAPATDSGALAQFAQAVRVRILRDDAVIGEETLWSEPGEPVAGVVRIDVPAAPSAGEEDPTHE